MRAVQIALVTLLAAPVSAQTTHTKQCDPDDAKSCVQPILVGEEAPFSGQLLTFRRAAKLAVKAGQCKERVQLAQDEARELAQIEVKTLESILENRQQSHEVQLDLMKRRMEELENSLVAPWYERPAFVLPVSVLGTIGVMTLSVKTLQILGQ